MQKIDPMGQVIGYFLFAPSVNFENGRHDCLLGRAQRIEIGFGG
jgi:hypothetical protein